MKALITITCCAVLVAVGVYLGNTYRDRSAADHVASERQTQDVIKRLRNARGVD